MTARIADTHLALWLIEGSDRLPRAARDMMCAPGGRWLLSIVSVWEVMLKHQVRPGQMLIDAETFLSDCEAAGFELLELKPAHIFAAADLPVVANHKDPFDRMLLAQAHRENAKLVTHDKAISLYEDPSVILV